MAGAACAEGMQEKRGQQGVRKLCASEQEEREGDG